MPQDNQRVFNPKTPLEYVLGLLEEEAGEVIQAVEKLRRFGLEGRYPDTGRTNFEQLQLELIDLRAIELQVDLELQKLDLPPLAAFRPDLIRRKLEKVYRLSRLSQANGLLEGDLVIADDQDIAEFPDR